MPEGQFLGSRRLYSYTTDSGDEIAICLDQTLGGIGGNGLIQQESGAGLPSKPQRFQPRVVFWKGVLNGQVKTKQIICNATGSLYTNSGSQNLTVDGVTGVTTGRRGERQSFMCTLPITDG